MLSRGGHRASDAELIGGRKQAANPMLSRGDEMPAIELRDLRKNYGRRAALRGLTLDVEGAQILGIVGPDGAGKTTLLRALAGLLEVEAERASVLGFDLRQDTASLRACLGYVPQTFGLYRELSVAENLRVVGRLHGLSDAEIERRGKALLERNGLLPFVDRSTGALSGGMKQKLAIASALLPDPQLLILDEPTAGVDVVARDEIWQILEERKAETLIVVSTSYLNEAAACDRLIYLDSGRVVASGTPTALCAATPFELYRAWGALPRTIAQAARKLPFVVAAGATGQFARVEVAVDRSPGAAAVCAALEALPGAGVVLAARAPLDMESTLRALAVAGQPPARQGNVA